VEEDCVILDIPEGVRLNLLGLVVQIDRVLITADRAGLLGGLLASLTCGGAGAADQLDALAQMVRAREIAPEEQAEGEEPAEGEEQAGGEEPAEGEEQAGGEEPAEGEEQAGDEEPAEGEEQAGDEEPAEGEEQAGDEEPAEDEEAGDEEPAEEEERAVEEEPARPRSRRGRGGGGRA
jgi:cobalamin biosynthesis protein CobT